uniref:Uncharacterized protein n=1 Tax=Glossina pallidipes TaxID=7398 RepID=A0A1A9ZAY5_GLOPL
MLHFPAYFNGAFTQILGKRIKKPPSNPEEVQWERTRQVIFISIFNTFSSAPSPPPPPSPPQSIANINPVAHNRTKKNSRAKQAAVIYVCIVVVVVVVVVVDAFALIKAFKLQDAIKADITVFFLMDLEIEV